MSLSPSSSAPISTDHMDRIKQDAERGIGASSGDTLRLLNENAILRKLPTCWSEVYAQSAELDALRDEVELLNAEKTRLLDQVKVLQSDANSWQSGYDEGRRMGTKTMLETRALDARLAGFWRSPKETPPSGVPLVVLRDADNVGNGLHAGHRSGRWLELTGADRAMFHCDMLSGGNVIGWVGAEEFKGLDDLRTDAARWRAFTNCARIKFFGWAGYEATDPNGNSPGNYRHFGGEFWSIHDAPTADKEKAKELLTGFADAAIAHAASAVAPDE